MVLSALQLPLRLSEPPDLLPCVECIAYGACGGHELPLLRPFGCIQGFGKGGKPDPDDMNPVHEERFTELWNDVDGLLDFDVRPLVGAPSVALPDYIPVLQHKGSRSRPPVVDVVAIPLFEILRMRKDGSYGPRFTSATELRRRYHLRPSTKILLTGVDDDRPIERFWQEHRVNNVGVALAQLDLVGVTAPNFSFFTDATGFQRLRNRKRILLSCERLSSAGVPIIPHLNALTRSDWQFWADFLKEHTEIEVICKEFQTGLRAMEEGRDAYEEIVQLQQKIGRSLHPILVAGGRFYQQAGRDFGRFSIVDSRPFMSALAREVLVESDTGFYREKRPTPAGDPVDELFDQNIQNHVLKLRSTRPDVLPQAPDSEGQLYLKLSNSTPYLTSHPAA